MSRGLQKREREGGWGGQHMFTMFKGVCGVGVEVKIKAMSFSEAMYFFIRGLVTPVLPIQGNITVLNWPITLD